MECRAILLEEPGQVCGQTWALESPVLLSAPWSSSALTSRACMYRSAPILPVSGLCPKVQVAPRHPDLALQHLLTGSGHIADLKTGIVHSF